MRKEERIPMYSNFKSFLARLVMWRLVAVHSRVCVSAHGREIAHRGEMRAGRIAVTGEPLTAARPKMPEAGKWVAHRNPVNV